MNYIIKLIVRHQLRKYKNSNEKNNEENFYDWCCNSFNDGDLIFKEESNLAKRTRLSIRHSLDIHLLRGQYANSLSYTKTQEEADADFLNKITTISSISTEKMDNANKTWLLNYLKRFMVDKKSSELKVVTDIYEVKEKQ